MPVQRQIDELLAIRASEWLDVLPAASEEQLRGLEAWLGESKLHVQEFLEVAEVEFCLSGLDAARKHDVDAVLARIAPKVVPLRRRAEAASAQSSAVQPQPQSRWSSRWRVMALAASVAVLAILAAPHLSNPVSSSEYSTGIGEQRVVELEDRSVVTMNADSQMSVRLEKHAREVDMPRGEAIFQVSHDADRPFRVHTLSGVVQVVGTQFNVQSREDGRTRVSVLEGRVRVSSSSHELVLGAGEAADIAANGRIERRRNVDVSNAFAWREHRLVFENATLQEMVAEFNRQNRAVRLRLEGVSAEGGRYDAVFADSDPNALADLLSSEPGLTVERSSSEIVIRRRTGR